jgi:hypothetical protein
MLTFVKRIKQLFLLKEIAKDFEKNYLMKELIVQDLNAVIAEKDVAYEVNVAAQEEKQALLDQDKESLTTATGDQYKKLREEIDILTAEVNMFEQRNTDYALKERKNLEIIRGNARAERDDNYNLFKKYEKIIKAGKYNAKY